MTKAEKAQQRAEAVAEHRETPKPRLKTALSRKSSSSRLDSWRFCER